MVNSFIQHQTGKNYVQILTFLYLQLQLQVVWVSATPPACFPTQDTAMTLKVSGWSKLDLLLDLLTTVTLGPKLDHWP